MPEHASSEALSLFLLCILIGGELWCLSEEVFKSPTSLLLPILCLLGEKNCEKYNLEEER